MKNGKYQAEIIRVVMGESKNGKELIEIVWQLGDTTVSSISYFTGKAEAITLRMMKHLGWNPGDDLSVMVGKENEISLYDDTYNGETRQKVRVSIPWEPVEGVQTPDDKQYSDARAKSFLASLTAEPGADPLASATETPDPGEDFPTDDIPF